MLSPCITYSHKFNQSGVDLTNLYKLRNAHQDAREGVMSTVPPGNSENPALQAYNRLHKELGYALRKCERGREQLLDILAPSKPAPETDEEDEFADAPPPLAHDLSSEDSTGPDSAFSERNSTFEIAVPDLEHTPQPLDDVTEHQGKDWAANSKCRGYMCFVRLAHWLAVIPDYAWMK